MAARWRAVRPIELERLDLTTEIAAWLELALRELADA